MVMGVVTNGGGGSDVVQMTISRHNILAGGEIPCSIDSHVEDLERHHVVKKALRASQKIKACIKANHQSRLHSYHHVALFKHRKTAIIIECRCSVPSHGGLLWGGGDFFASVSVIARSAILSLLNVARSIGGCAIFFVI
jgi:hypothetical protein